MVTIVHQGESYALYVDGELRLWGHTLEYAQIVEECLGFGSCEWEELEPNQMDDFPPETWPLQEEE